MAKFTVLRFGAYLMGIDANLIIYRVQWLEGLWAGQDTLFKCVPPIIPYLDPV
jgi:hypothetical protein